MTREEREALVEAYIRYGDRAAKWEDPTPHAPRTCGIIAALIVAALAGALSSCASHRQPVTTCNHLDTARVEVREREVWRTDTVRVQLPAEVKERTTRDTASTLRTSLAESRAVWSAGELTHTLRNIAQPVRVPVHARTIYIDSVATRTQVVEVEKPVERKLTPWQRTRLNTWPYLAAAVLLAAAWAGRKPIARIARSLLK